MAAPDVVDTYPANGDVGIPVGATILVYFDRSVDLQSVLDSIILHGADFDFRSGPDSTMWISEDGVSNPYFLSSPGFKGVAPLDVELVYLGGENTEVTPDASQTRSSEAERDAGLIHLAKITLKPDFNAQFAAETEYTLDIVGDPDGQLVGVRSRSVFTQEDVAVAGDGTLYSGGSYTGLSSDTVHVKITRAGDINSAKYKYWYESAGEGTAIAGRVASSRWRVLESGIKVRFGGDNFLVGDEWKFVVEPAERLATNYRVVFTTNDGSYTTAPATTSTPATSQPPITVLPGYTGDGPQIVSMTPASGSYGNDRVTEIVIVFDRAIDADSITADSLKLFTYPVEGFYQYTEAKKPLQYTYVLAGNTLTIRI